MPRYETITVLAIVHLQSCFILSEWKNVEIQYGYHQYVQMHGFQKKSDYKIRQELVSDSYFCKTIK